MILDQNLRFCTNQSHNGASVVQFTDTVDLLQNRDLGSGGRQIFLHIHITTAFAGGLAGMFQLFQCASTTINVAVQPLDYIVCEAVYAIGDLGLNTHIFLPLAKPITEGAGSGTGVRPVEQPWRYLIGQFTPTGTMTAGQFTAGLTLDPAIGAYAYPSNLTII